MTTTYVQCKDLLYCGPEKGHWMDLSLCFFISKADERDHVLGKFSQQLLTGNESRGSAGFTKFLRWLSPQALELQFLFDNSVNCTACNAGLPGNVTYRLMSHRFTFLTQNELFNGLLVSLSNH